RYEYAGQFPGISKKGISSEFQLSGYRSLYGATKLASEFVLREYSMNYSLPAIINRCGVIAGPWQLGKVDQGVFTHWLASHFFKKDLKYIGFGGKGKQVRDLLHINDLIELIRLQLKNISKFKGDIFNAGGSAFSNLSLIETTKICENLTSHKIKIVPDLNDRPADIIWYITDNGNTEKQFSWKPTSSAEIILTDTFNWLKENETLFKKILN
ncbi:MAG: GDP-mannose 4,6-dehydratase, partial [Bacteroidetes bacterium]|nr:GDP-mannose 4,6-dehydratase [Bacteroidota bacterium]